MKKKPVANMKAHGGGGKGGGKYGADFGRGTAKLKEQTNNSLLEGEANAPGAGGESGAPEFTDKTS